MSLKEGVLLSRAFAALLAAVFLGIAVGDSRAAEVDAMTVETAWWMNGSAHLRWENAGGQQIGNASALMPLHSSLGQNGSLAGALYFLEPYAQWVDGGAYQAGLGLGLRHLFGRQSVESLSEPRTRIPGLLDQGFYLGTNLFVNTASTEMEDRFTQLSWTVEIGTRWLELRGRYHFPVSDPREQRDTYTFQDSETTRSGGMTYQVDYDFSATWTWLVESLRGWQADASFVVPGLDRWVDLRLLAGYAAFESPSVAGMEYDSWRFGVDFRPVPAVVLSAMWYENEVLVGDHWMFGVGVELPLAFSNSGDGRGGFWRQIKNAFKPRERHLIERMIEPARRHSLPMQVGSSLRGIDTAESYRASVILPDGRVVTLVEGERRSSYRAGGGAGSGSLTLTGSEGANASVITTTGGTVDGEVVTLNSSATFLNTGSSNSYVSTAGLSGLGPTAVDIMGGGTQSVSLNLGQTGGEIPSLIGMFSGSIFSGESLGRAEILLYQP